jgi:hypothetical protein
MLVTKSAYSNRFRETSCNDDINVSINKSSSALFILRNEKKSLSRHWKHVMGYGVHSTTALVAVNHGVKQ